MNSSTRNDPPQADKTKAYNKAKKESRTRFFARLATKTSKTIAIAILCVSISFAGGVLSNDNVEAHYALQEPTITMNFEQCVAMFQVFYSEYPSYHYEDINDTISIDYIVPNPEEEAWQYCWYFFYGE